MIERNLQNKHVRPDGLDLHFGSFEKQIEQVLLNSKNKNYEVEVGDIIVTRHSNMGGISYLYNLVGTEQLDKQLFIKANQNMNRNLVIPLEMFWGEGKNVKEIG